MDSRSTRSELRVGVAAGTKVGPSHVASGMPCQDAAEICVVDGIAFGALSDGVGSARRSDLGARVAVEAAVEFLAGVPGERISAEDAGEWAPECLEHTRSRVREAATREGLAELDLACTLMGVVASGHATVVFSVGDGFAVGRFLGAHDYDCLLGPPESFKNEVCPIQYADADGIQIHATEDALELICLSSDGLIDLALDYHKRPNAALFGLVDRRSGETSDEMQRFLTAFLDSPGISGSRLGDDKSVLLIRRWHEADGADTPGTDASDPGALPEQEDGVVPGVVPAIPSDAGSSPDSSGPLDEPGVSNEVLEEKSGAGAPSEGVRDERNGMDV